MSWNWLSLNVVADDMTVSSLFEKIADDVETVKSQTKWLKNEGGSWNGELTDNLSNDQMYAVKMTKDRTLHVVGLRVNPDDCPITLHRGWNWIGYYGRQVSSVKDAFGNMAPLNGDVLKAQVGVAYYDTNDWSGSIKAIEPSKGYVVQTLIPANSTKQFSYPSSTVAGSRKAARTASSATEEVLTTGVFTPVDYHLYSGNAIMAAKVVIDGKPVADAELGVFADEECRAAAKTNADGVVYLTIPGDDATTLSFMVAKGRTVVAASEKVGFEVDADYGSPLQPMVIDLGTATGIELFDSEDPASGIYDLSGRKIETGSYENRRLSKGVYIVNGQKKVVK